SSDRYSTFLTTVSVPNITATIVSAAAAAVDVMRLIDATPITASTTRPTRGRYMRRSAPTSVAIGTMLDVGASVMKNHDARNPTGGHRTRSAQVKRTSAAIRMTYGRTSVSVSGTGHP